MNMPDDKCSAAMLRDLILWCGLALMLACGAGAAQTAHPNGDEPHRAPAPRHERGVLFGHLSADPFGDRLAIEDGRHAAAS